MKKYMNKSVIIQAIIILAIQTFAACVSMSGAGKYDPWEEYCKEFGIDPENPTEDDENYFLDVWCEQDGNIMSWND